MRSRLALASAIIGILIIGSFSNVLAYTENITVSAGSVKIKSVYLEKGDTVSYGFNVYGGKNNDVKFSIHDPDGYQKRIDKVYNYLRSSFVAQKTGNYDFIFDNQMSYISKKSVQFDWHITKPTLGVGHSDTSGYVVNSAGWFYILVFAGIIGTIIAVVASYKRKKRKETDYSGLHDEGKDNKPSANKKEKKSSNKRCWHNDSWVRDDRMEICSSCGKELGKRLGKGNESELKEESKPIEAQQNLDSYVAQNILENNSLEKETINDIERNEEALGILKERLAKGEISVKDFQEIKKELS